MAIPRIPPIGVASLPGQLRTQQPQQHLILAPRVLRVILEAVALEVLYRVRFVIRAYRLHKLLGYRVAELGKAAVLVPVVEKSPAEGVAGGSEPLHAWLVEVEDRVGEEDGARG